MITRTIEETKTIRFHHMNLLFEPEYQMVWARFQYPGRPCMSQDLLRDVARAQQIVAEKADEEYKQVHPSRLQYQVLCSGLKGVFSLGGDLARFINLIEQKNRDALHRYAKACIDVLYQSATSYGLPFTTISLVQGEALGGGFEAALSANVLIAEKQARFGFPETVFGLFPGMGAFSFLARRLNPGLAKRLIASGRVYSAEELYEMGVIDVLVSDGKGEQAVYEYIQHQRHRCSGFYGLDKVVEQYNPLSYIELENVIDLWVDTAMQLSQKNIKLMQYLVQAQEKRWGNNVQLKSMAG
ncbi:MAG: enoyl-CoA hydratase/isomerase family protein [Gammaproteobacteria bacterium]|nr:enoyl-CoA hydratase/isomerase family protein [Gammaproteobacteria bacterium]